MVMPDPMSGLRHQNSTKLHQLHANQSAIGIGSVHRQCHARHPCITVALSSPSTRHKAQPVVRIVHDTLMAAHVRFMRTGHDIISLLQRDMGPLVPQREGRRASVADLVSSKTVIPAHCAYGDLTGVSSQASGTLHPCFISDLGGFSKKEKSWRPAFKCPEKTRAATPILY